MPRKEIREVDKLIKDAKDFMALWVKFHELYKEAIKDKVISPEEEKTFLETKSVIARRYQALIDEIGAPSSPEDRIFDVISSILSLETVASLSDMQLAKIEQDWHNSYISLNRLLGGLETQREKLCSHNPLKENLLKKIGPAISFLLLVCAIIIAYAVLVNIFHIDETLRRFLEGGKR